MEYRLWNWETKKIFSSTRKRIVRSAGTKKTLCGQSVIQQDPIPSIFSSDVRARHIRVYIPTLIRRILMPRMNYNRIEARGRDERAGT